MKKISSLLFICIFGLSLFANAQVKEKEEEQKPEGYIFTEIVRLPTLSVKDQSRAGTCWSWSATAFFESEMYAYGQRFG